MRIIAGKHKGRNIASPSGKEAVRPTGSLARGAIFNILAHGTLEGGFAGKRVADICCGTGALGFEALSRGAAHVTFVDNAGAPLALVRQTAEAFGEERAVRLLKCDAMQLPKAQQPYDLVFLDPPYKSRVVEKALKSLKENGWVAENSIIVVERSRHEEVKEIPGFRGFDDRHYGAARVMLYRYEPLPAQ